MKKSFLLSICGIIFASGTLFAQLPPSIKCWQAAKMLADSARALEDTTIVYSPAYWVIPYPNGDVPAKTGACTDVVVRAFRKAFNWDLQKSIYEYRKARKLPTNTNIDHRRVKNLMPYFDNVKFLRNDKGGKYLKGNIIVWNIGNGQMHIGICVDDDVIIHNICCGQEIEPMYMKEKVVRNYTWICPELEGLTPQEIYEKYKAGKL